MPPIAPLILVTIFSIASVGFLAYDGITGVIDRRRRRRASGGGAFGVVVDREGRVLGTYIDPFGHPWRAARMHGPESAWSPPLRFGESAFAWEGFGETAEDAFTAANRLRRRHIQLLPMLNPIDDDEGDSGDLFAGPGA